MENKKLTFLKIAMVAVLGVTTFMGCKKKDVVVEQPKTPDISVSDLKIYFGELIRLDTSKISYDSNLEKFFIDGKEQISFKELKEQYLKFPIVHYKDGKPVVN